LDFEMKKSRVVGAIRFFLWLENGVLPEAQTVMVPFAPAWGRSKIMIDRLFSMFHDLNMMRRPC